MKLSVIAKTVWKLYHWDNMKGENKALEAGRLKLHADIEALRRNKAKAEQERAEGSSSGSDSDDEDKPKTKKSDKQVENSKMKKERDIRREGNAQLKKDRDARRDMRVKRKAEADLLPKTQKVQGRPKKKAVSREVNAAEMPALADGVA